MPFVGHGTLIFLEKLAQATPMDLNNSLSNASANATMVHIAVVPRRIEFAILMDMNGNIQYVWIVFECLLNAVSLYQISLERPQLG